MTSNYFMMKRRKPHYKRKNERLPKMAKCLGVNSIPVRVTSEGSRKCLFKGISEILFYPVLGFVRYLSAILEKQRTRCFYAPFFSCSSSLLRKPKAKSIAFETLACAVWNI